MNPYVPLLIMSAAALVLAFGGLVASAILGPTRKSKTKADNYECGIQPTSAHLTEGRFSVYYYLVVMTFIIFDIEIVLMYPWAASFNQPGPLGLVVMVSSLVTLCVPYAYEWRRGGLGYRDISKEKTSGT